MPIDRLIRFLYLMHCPLYDRQRNFENRFIKGLVKSKVNDLEILEL